jgi:glutathione peroxidase
VYGSINTLTFTKNIKIVMKSFLIVLMLFCTMSVQSKENIHNISIKDIDGNLIELSSFKGKYILFVNVASNCGFTKQYADLQALYQKYMSDLVIIGLPCNQFGAQEPAREEEIKQFCTKNFGVSFILTEKIDVKGNNISPLYAWLTDKKYNGVLNSSVKWNFQKYLVDRDGELINYFYSTTNPLSNKITSLIILE